MKLSVAMITYNEEKNLERTLKAIKDVAYEIVIVDSGSTDNTKEIALAHMAKFYTEEWKGYGAQKNSAIEKCSGEWILIIDADEEISPELLEEIKEVSSKDKDVYEVNFLSVCFGKKIKHGGWSNTYRIRLFKNGIGKFNTNEVHEEFIHTGSLGRLSGKIYHHSYNDINDYLTKFNRYTGEGAKEYFNRGKKSSIFNCTVNPFFKFIRMYLFRGGFLDGMEGFLLSVLSANYTMVKYLKLREMYRNKESI